MNIDIEVFHYKIVSHINNAPHIVDWETVGLANAPALFRTEPTNWSFEYNAVNNGHEVIISSDINVPCGVVHNNAALDGTFYRYAGQTTFFVTEIEITAEVIGELALFHFGRYPPIIAVDTSGKTNGQHVHNANIFCLAKLIVTASTQF